MYNNSYFKHGFLNMNCLSYCKFDLENISYKAYAIALAQSLCEAATGQNTFIDMVQSWQILRQDNF